MIKQGVDFIATPKSTVYSKSYTATDDAPFRIESNPEVIVTGLNIHCYTFACYYGNMQTIEGEIAANGTVWFDSHRDGIRVSDFMFKNKTAGSNTKIVVVGTLKGKVQ